MPYRRWNVCRVNFCVKMNWLLSYFGMNTFVVTYLLPKHLCSLICDNVIWDTIFFSIPFFSYTYLLPSYLQHPIKTPKPMINSSAKTTRPTRIPALPPINKRRRYVLSISKDFFCIWIWVTYFYVLKDVNTYLLKILE